MHAASVLKSWRRGEEAIPLQKFSRKRLAIGQSNPICCGFSFYLLEIGESLNLDLFHI